MQSPTDNLHKLTVIPVATGIQNDENASLMAYL